MFSQVKNIFFDFDGVILDSVDCKTQAFEKNREKPCCSYYLLEFQNDAD